eukprot:5479971-Prymnesium_polylepis.1
MLRLGPNVYSGPNSQRIEAVGVRKRGEIPATANSVGELSGRTSASSSPGSLPLDGGFFSARTWS